MIKKWMLGLLICCLTLMPVLSGSAQAEQVWGTESAGTAAEVVYAAEEVYPAVAAPARAGISIVASFLPMFLWAPLLLVVGNVFWSIIW